MPCLFDPDPDQVAPVGLHFPVIDSLQRKVHISIQHYTKKAADWEAACVGSVARFGSVGSGLWAFQFRSPTVCPKPVLFAFAGGGLGVGWSSKAGVRSPVDVSFSEDTIGSRSDRQQADSAASTNRYSGFSKLICDRPFSLNKLNYSGGRLTVAELYIGGAGTAWIFISSFAEAKSLFNSQGVFGSGLTPNGLSFMTATTGGVWKSEYLGHLVPSRAASPRRKDADVCSIHDLAPDSVKQSVRNFTNPKPYNGPSIRQR